MTKITIRHYEMHPTNLWVMGLQNENSVAVGHLLHLQLPACGITDSLSLDMDSHHSGVPKIFHHHHSLNQTINKGFSIQYQADILLESNVES